MERRCAVYSRYSSDLQRDSSIEDQIRKCRERAAANRWSIVEEFVLFDKASSGSSVMGRDALSDLISAAKRKPCPFDCVLVDDTSRLARNLSDSLRTIEILAFHGVAVVSVSQGIDSTQPGAKPLFTFNGMMDEQFLDGLRDKVHRGQEGRVIKGLHPGGRCYGYRNIPILDPTRTEKYGRPAVRGVQLEIIPEEAAVVRRIFELYAKGVGLAGIAYALNAEGVPSPRPANNRLRQAWSRYTIREMIHNERYRGIVVWNRTQKKRNPETGRKISKARPQSDWRRQVVPQIRIISEELWAAAHRRNAEVNADGISKLGGMARTASSRKYLFSGLLVCGQCRGNMVIVSGSGKRGYVKYGCHAHKHVGTTACRNNWFIRRDRLEAQLLGAIEARILTPERIDYVVQRCEEQVLRRLTEMRRDGSIPDIESLRTRKEELEAQSARLTDAIAMGGDMRCLLDRLRSIQAETDDLKRQIEGFRPADANISLTTQQIRECVISQLMELKSSLTDAQMPVAKQALARHLGRLVLTPKLQDGRRVFEVSGQFDLGAGANRIGVMQLVARDGIGIWPPADSS